MRAPLGIVISDSIRVCNVAKYVDDFRFTKTAPGGHHSASMRINLPLDTFPDLGPADRIDISDGRTGRILWSGYTDNPGSTDGTSGQFFELAAMGGVMLASDRSEKLIYLERAYDGWRTDDYSNLGVAPSATCEIRDFPDAAGGGHAGSQCVYLQFTPGQPVGTSSRAALIGDIFTGSPMTLGAAACWRDGGSTDANYAIRLNAHPWVGGDTRLIDTTLSATAAVLAAYAGTDFPVDKVGLHFVMQRLNSATNVTTDNVWIGLGEVTMYAHLVDRYGADRSMATAAHITLGATTDNPAVIAYILASDVAEDLVGRILDFCDPVTAVIDTTTAQIDQLAYLDGATAAQVFDDLALHEPDFYWGIGDRLLSGKHRFWYRAWPTTARYEISTKDGYQAPGGDVDLCNRITVYWTDSKGVKQSTVRTSVVPELDDVGRVRDAESITLPDGVGSLANAQRIGDAVLASKADPPKAATAVVRRRIMDHLTGNEVDPWEIEPGYLVRVRETGDLLRLTETEYVDNDCAVTMTLGEPVLSTEQRVARLPQTGR